MAEPVAGDFPQVGSSGATVSPAWKREGTLYVVAADCLTYDVIGPMVAQGELPHLAQLAREGCSGRIATVSPTNSSMIWTSIGTGCDAKHHGIDGFSYSLLLGKHVSRSTVRKIKRIGLKAIIQALQGIGLMQTHLLDGRHVRAKRFWEIISEAGGKVGVVNWWHTWPAEPVNGFMISDRLHFWRVVAKRGDPLPETDLCFPEDLLDAVRSQILEPDGVTVDDIRPFVSLPEHELQQFVNSEFRHHELSGELRFMIALDRTCCQVFDRCLDLYPDLVVGAVYLRSPDIASHCAFHYMPAAEPANVQFYTMLRT